MRQFLLLLYRVFLFFVRTFLVQSTCGNGTKSFLKNQLDLCFDCAQTLFRLYSTYISTLLEFCFDSARHMFRFSPSKLGMFRQRSFCVSTVLDPCVVCVRPMFRLSRPIFRLWSTYVLRLISLKIWTETVDVRSELIFAEFLINFVSSWFRSP